MDIEGGEEAAAPTPLFLGFILFQVAEKEMLWFKLGKNKC